MCATTKIKLAHLLPLMLLLLLSTMAFSIPVIKNEELPNKLSELNVLIRPRRQFDFNLSAEHDDKEDETEIALEAIANLWRSQDGNTQVEGSAKVIHRSNSLQSGNTRYSAHLHVHHDYKRK